MDRHWDFEEYGHEEIEAVGIVDTRADQVLPYSENALKFVCLDYVFCASAEVGLQEPD